MEGYGGEGGFPSVPSVSDIHQEVYQACLRPLQAGLSFHLHCLLSLKFQYLFPGSPFSAFDLSLCSLAGLKVTLFSGQHSPCVILLI